MAPGKAYGREGGATVEGEDGQDHAIEVHLDRLLAERGMTLTELAQRVGVTHANLSILKNGHARAVRFTTLTRLCEELDCQPGDLLSHRR
ncbi:transcriptional regulator [Streptomyces triticagri]|uniref:Transcriptional regulator n=1 Tax=Streptomyces triticagri TaxID=2293568 RepID=A0A372M4Q1_9ACTN|nr:helix-turn-helix transcriptional regulator [Streptomyces triticagri]RFU85902.1 transcriptional regulator [Streptomyces triticagri]